jgi:hypothetical protein
MYRGKVGRSLVSGPTPGSAVPRQGGRWFRIGLSGSDGHVESRYREYFEPNCTSLSDHDPFRIVPQPAYPQPWPEEHYYMS